MSSVTPGDLLRRITHLHTALQQEGANCCGITSLTRCQILTTVGRDGTLTLAGLSRRLNLDKGWLSRTIDDLVHSGLIHKQPSTTDKRTIDLTLTPQGQHRVAALSSELNDQSGRVIDRLPVTERHNVLRALELLADALEAELNSQEPSLCPVC
ncbi:MarR family transcriptional regulator [Deinococcus deserti]|uniref:Putative transcriptional regulator, MarR family n=1 Tax=Deinococcus deserti (strain DSM 17065 / CIP 109153 / LMG 22923 / VCD115) TaxID=546414 RepID=C1CUV9_DEIDV|nr:MarR family transcriptional regulator [Deinococcus deserti]ACO45976.1 putative transcriptional regulator, MarR family [Deinococcus deserti VCD115]